MILLILLIAIFILNLNITKENFGFWKKAWKATGGKAISAGEKLGNDIDSGAKSASNMALSEMEGLSQDVLDKAMGPALDEIKKVKNGISDATNKIRDMPGTIKKDMLDPVTNTFKDIIIMFKNIRFENR